MHGFDNSLCDNLLPGYRLWRDETSTIVLCFSARFRTFLHESRTSAIPQLIEIRHVQRSPSHFVVLPAFPLSYRLIWLIPNVKKCLLFPNKNQNETSLVFVTRDSCGDFPRTVRLPYINIRSPRTALILRTAAAVAVSYSSPPLLSKCLH